MLSIIIPYYKLTFFEKTLESLADQTDKRFKVYIGNDNSPENPTNLIGKYAGHFDYVYHKFETNIGKESLIKQWERCIALSVNEKWIMILGDDDVLGNNVVEEFYKQYKIFNKKTNVVRFATVTQNYKKKDVSGVYTHPVWEKSSASYFRRFKERTRSSLSEYIFKRSIYNKKGFYNFSLAWHSDDWAWLEFSDGKPIFTINESIIKIGFSDISLSGMDNNHDLKNQATLEFYKKIIKGKLRTFSAQQALELLKEYEFLIKKNRKLTMPEWLLLKKKYIICKSILFFKQIKKNISSVIK